MPCVSVNSLPVGKELMSEIFIDYNRNEELTTTWEVAEENYQEAGGSKNDETQNLVSKRSLVSVS